MNVLLEYINLIHISKNSENKIIWHPFNSLGFQQVRQLTNCQCWMFWNQGTVNIWRD